MTWEALFHKPKDHDIKAWFNRIADRLLNGCDYLIAGESHRFTEIELYYYEAELHPDIFAHRDPVQLNMGRWYFHRTRGVYRSGSFKGLDLSFGDGTAYGGVLLRGIERPDGSLIDGPSLHVDYLLKQTGHPDIASLDEEIHERLGWDGSCPVHLTEAEREPREIYRTARIGLSLKRMKPPHELATKYLLRRYRYLTEPKRIKKGKLHLVISLHQDGASPERIRGVTGSPTKTIERYLNDYATGGAAEEYFGRELKPADLCRLHGILANHESSRD